MANGRVHFIGNLLTGSIAICVTKLYLPEQFNQVLLGSLCGLFITPDMDLEGRTHTENLLRKIPVIGLLFQVSWYLYALLFAHRGLSHNIFIGTLSRIIYSLLLIIFWLLLVTGIIYITGNTNNQIWLTVYNWLQCYVTIPMLFIWFLQDCNHYLLDILFDK